MEDMTMLKILSGAFSNYFWATTISGQKAKRATSTLKKNCLALVLICRK